MTKKHFIRAASIVKAILDGHWTTDLPSWAKYSGDFADGKLEVSSDTFGNVDPNYVRAVWTAEAFIHLAQEFNPRFDAIRFLTACGLAGKP